MLKIIKFAKKSWIWILTVIVLLVVQANCDLALPQYTSDIVDVGIQSMGVEENVPEAMTQSTYNIIAKLSNGEKVLEKYYTQVTHDDLSKEEIEGYEKKYPEFRSEDIYVLKESRAEDVQELYETIHIASAIYVMALSEQGEYDVESAIDLETMQKQLAMMTGNEAVEHMTLRELIPYLPDEVVTEITNTAEEKLSEMEGLVGDSVSASFVTQVYEELGVDMEKKQMDYLLGKGMQMLLLALLGMAVSIVVTMIASRVAAITCKDLRNKTFRKVIGFSNAEMDNFSTASLITRCTNDIQQIQMVIVMMLRMVAYAPILGVGGLIKVFQSTSSMAWIIAVAVIAVLCIVLVLMLVAMPKFKIMQKLVDRLNLVSREILTGIPVVRAFSREKHEEERFDKASRDLMKTQLFTNRAMAVMMPTMMFVMNGITVLIVWIGAHGIDTGDLQVGDMMAFITYTMQIVMSFLMLTMISIMLPRATVAADRVEDILKSETYICDPEREETPKQEQGLVRFEHVSFRYPGAEENVLTDIDFTANPGETTAIIGSTGCGKSTVVHLIPRLYDATEGRITIDDVDIRNMSLQHLRDMIGFVPQKGILFSGTIESNLRFGAKEAPIQEIEHAAQTAQAMEFIEEKPDKFNSYISQGGSNVSGGQKQRLSIARAVAKNPKIYVFDDSFSALDFKTDVAVRKALKEKTKDSVVLIVAQRISTILHAEKIIVLDEGRIAGMGTHEELLRDNEVYRQIAMSQLSEKELGMNQEQVKGGEQ